MHKIPELSIFFPFWNEEKNVETVVKNAIPVARKIATLWEIIIVDDGSSDNTLKIAHKLAKENKNIVVASHTPNRGYGAALKEGFDKAKYNTIVFSDGDRQFDFAQVSRFLEKIEKADMVIGYREKRMDHPVRHFLMTLLKIWDFLFFRIYFKDIDCGFKMFRRQALNKILPLRSEGAMITTEILAKAKKAKLKIVQVKVTHLPRRYGDQSGGNFRVVFRAIRESFVLWRELRNGRA
jgi:glycosyltransferase involved in cell wall biosynthesis